MQEVHHRRGHHLARESEHPGEHGQVGIEAARREQRAVRRAGHPHHAFDLQLPGAGTARELLEVHRVVRAQPGGRDLRAAACACQHLRDEASARMREQVQARSLGKRGHQRERVS